MLSQTKRTNKTGIRNSNSKSVTKLSEIDSLWIYRYAYRKCVVDIAEYIITYTICQLQMKD